MKFLLLLLTCASLSANAQTFRGYECTQDCSGHRAGYAWAKNKRITVESYCTSRSNSFNEGCEAYVKESR